MPGVADPDTFVDRRLFPGAEVRIAAFDGENADPVNGRRLEADLLAFTPWGELAFQLAGRTGFERVRESDRLRIAPGAATLRELFAGRPTLILLDELAVWLRKAKPLAGSEKAAREQLTAFLSALIGAVESTPRTALVFTIAVGREGRAQDAYAAEHEAVVGTLDELASVAARKATILNPTRDDEMVKVLRRRLFERIDEAGAEPIVAAYAAIWRRHADALPPSCRTDEPVRALRESWPFHPDLVAVLREKTSSIGKFQRIRGMLRLLGRTVHRIWQERPRDALAIHAHHVDLGFQPIREELTTRIERPDMVPPLAGDVAAGDRRSEASSVAGELDRQYFAGLPPYASYVARAIFLHSLAYPDDRAGIDRTSLRFALLSPALDFDMIEQARNLFAREAFFLDDRPGAPYRFKTEPNLTQIVRRQEQQVDSGDLRDSLNGRIHEIFGGKVLELVRFPGGPFDVPDETSERRPRLVLIGHEAATVDRLVVKVPELVLKIYRHRGQAGDFRRARNHLLFLVAEAQEVDRMQELVRRRLALETLKQPPWTEQLAPYQREQVKEGAERIEADVASAIQKAYRHIFYPSRTRMEGCEEDLAHTVLEHHTAAHKPGDGQKMIIERLRELGKLRLPEDEPDSPAYVRDRTPLKKGTITTGKLRQEFFEDPSLPMLVGDDVFIKLVRRGVEQGEFVYREGDLIWAKGLPPPAKIAIGEEAELFTATAAREQGIWPRPAPPPAEPPPAEPLPAEPPTAPRPRPVGDVGPQPAPSAPPASLIEVEGVLKEALARLFEQARGKGWKALAWLELRPFEPAEAFTLAGLVSLVPKAQKRIRYAVAFETREGSECHLQFEGVPDDERPVRDFLRPQLQAALDAKREVDFECTLKLVFESGLLLAGSEPAQLAERLARAGAAAAQVRASAEGQA